MLLDSEVDLDVVAIGAAAIDLVVKVKRHPAPDQIVFAEEFGEFPGGSTANVAVALAKFGVKVGFLGKVGKDRYGEMLLNDFRREGVDVSRVIIEGSARTAATFIAVDQEGKRIIYSLGGKALLESPEELDLPYIMKSRIIYVGEAYPKVVAGALSSARERGITVISNPGVNFNLFGEDAMNIVKTSDLVIMSSKEISLISKDLENGARYLLQEGPRAVIVTLGSAGSLLIRQEAIPEKVPAFRTKVVDTTGAGDVFTAGII
ncbi:MAG: hypothetical protein DRN90_06235, partial [Thermoproteota archaeon]